MKRIALFTYGHIVGELGSPIVQDYVDLTVSVFALNEKFPGFIGLVPFPEGLIPPFFNKEKYVSFVTLLSIWASLESIVAFSYYGPHGEAFRRRKAWFYEIEIPTNAGWWIDADYTPTWEEAFERQRYLHDHGPTAHAFPVRKPFDAEGNPYLINRAEVRNLTDSIPELRKVKQ